MMIGKLVRIITLPFSRKTKTIYRRDALLILRSHLCIPKMYVRYQQQLIRNMMKWILAILLLISATTFGQTDDTTKYISYPTQYGMKIPRIWAPTTMIMPSGDTTGKRPGKTGAFMTCTCDGNVYRWNGSNWVAFGGSSTTLNNVGTGYAWATTPNGSVKKFNPTYGLIADSSTSNTISLNIDTTSTNHVVTQSDLNDAIGSTVSGINQLTGDVTAGPGSGSQAATIANNAVTTAKINNAAVTIAKISATGTADNTTVLYGDGAWRAPAGGGIVYTFSATAPTGSDTSKLWIKTPAVAGVYNVYTYISNLQYPWQRLGWLSREIGR